jgi:hypothetical protein
MRCRDVPAEVERPRESAIAMRTRQCLLVRLARLTGVAVRGGGRRGCRRHGCRLAPTGRNDPIPDLRQHAVQVFDQLPLPAGHGSLLCEKCLHIAAGFAVSVAALPGPAPAVHACGVTGAVALPYSRWSAPATYGAEQASRGVAPRPDVSATPLDDGRCPASHPVKVTVNLKTGQCVYHEPGGPHYEQVRPDVCFATEEAARLDDCWKAGEVL